MRIVVKRVICIILTLAVAFSLLWYTNQVLLIKRTDGITTMQDFYAQDANSVDLLILGSSHSGMNLDTETFWTEYGISSFVLWGSVQPFWNSYHFLVEALKTQTPKVVVLDVYAATQTFEYSDDARQVTNLAGMKLSENKLEAIQVSAPQERWMDLVLGFPIYHQRYSELTINDFLHFPWNKSLINNKGTGNRYGVGNYPLLDVSGITNSTPIHEKEEIYLRKIINLCRDVDIPLVLITTPTVPREAEQPYYNAVAQIAKESNIPYYNFNLMDAQTGFNAKHYWVDGGHLNTNGARVISRYLGKLLMDAYHLPDHRGETAYRSWDVSALNLQNEYIKQITDRDDYFVELSKNSRSLVIIKNSTWENTESYESVVKGLSSIGVDYEEFMASSGGVWLLTDTHDGDFINQYFGNLHSEFEFDGQTFTVDFKNGTGISINGQTITNLGGAGIICLVYDCNTKTYTDITAFYKSNNFSLNHK